jgi:hypothetical protein
MVRINFPRDNQLNLNVARGGVVACQSSFRIVPIPRFLVMQSPERGEAPANYDRTYELMKSKSAANSAAPKSVILSLTRPFPPSS